LNKLIHHFLYFIDVFFIYHMNHAPFFKGEKPLSLFLHSFSSLPPGIGSPSSEFQPGLPFGHSTWVAFDAPAPLFPFPSTSFQPWVSYAIQSTPAE
jgi:hypothetical protein